MLELQTEKLDGLGKFALLGEGFGDSGKDALAEVVGETSIKFFARSSYFFSAASMPSSAMTSASMSPNI